MPTMAPPKTAENRGSTLSIFSQCGMAKARPASNRLVTRVLKVNVQPNVRWAST